MKKDITISAALVVHNEEKHLDDCLKSLSFADEIVVVLDKCSDNSKLIAKKYNVKIIEGSWNIEGARRNIALQNCTGKWILELDADERVSENLKKEILLNIKSGQQYNYSTKINNHIGKKSINNGWLRTIAVQERQFIHYNGNKIYHEDKRVHPTGDLKGIVKKLKNPIIHYMDNDISDLINRFNKYTGLRASDMLSSNKKLKKQKLFKIFLSFINQFFKAFIIKKGYKEGGIGLLISLLSSSFNLVSYLKALELKESL